MWVGLFVSECVCDFGNVILRKSSFCDNVLDFFMLVCAELGWDGEGGAGLISKLFNKVCCEKKERRCCHVIF